MSDRVLRLGLAGLGAGARNILSGVTSHKGFRVAAGADVREQATQRFAEEFGAKPFPSLEAMCDSSDIDAVWIVTPNQHHARHAVYAADHGKHVVVSKPMAVTLDECKAMIAAAAANGVQLVAGHTQSMLPGARGLAELARSGKYGRVGMVQSWNFTPWVYRPRMPEELDERTGGGVVFRQAPHHIDIVRLIGGGMVRSVRAMTLKMDPERPVSGAFTAYLEFEDGTPATIVYNGYGHFDADELNSGERNSRRASQAAPVLSRSASREQQAELKESIRYGSAATAGRTAPDQGLAPFGYTLVSCELADLRQSNEGVVVYGEGGKVEEIALAKGEHRGWAELDELYQAVTTGKPVTHDGRWGLATQEVAVAILESARTRQEVRMQHQVPVPA